MLDVDGMKCAGCVRAVENQLRHQPGVVTATVNLVTQAAMVECEPSVDPQALAQKLTETGFPTQVRGDDEPASIGLTPAEKQQQETQRQIGQLVIAALLLFFSAIGHLDHLGWITVPGFNNIWLHWGLATVALLFPGRTILVDGWRGLRHNMPNMNTLVGLGTLTAYVASLVALLFPNLGWECFFDEPVMLVGFILLGRALEQQARSRATGALQSLIALQPALARLVKDPIDPTLPSGAGDPPIEPASSVIPTLDSVEIPARLVKVGEWLQVLPGEKMPVDGEVVSGQTTVDESMLTGEALPVVKSAGAPVTAGSLNLTSLITIRATRTGRDTTLAQIIALVEAAQTRKAPIQRLADLIAGYFTYGVMTLAGFTFCFWYWIGLPLWSDVIDAHLPQIPSVHAMMPMGAEMAQEIPEFGHPSPLLLSLKLAIAVLVIACPCALGLATPTAILVGSSLGAEQGLLIRGGDVLEKVHRLQTIVFDKTGTLTVGQPTVTDCVAIHPDWSAAKLLQVAATVERGTQHPLSLAIQQAALQQNLPLLPAEAFQTEPGYGIAAIVAGQPIAIGTAEWCQQQAVMGLEQGVDAVTAWEAAGKTPIYVAAAGELVGLIAAQDRLRPDARTTVQQLQQMGLQVHLLTGDRPQVAQAIADQLQLDATAVFANVRPAQKAAIIQSLQAPDSAIGLDSQPDPSSRNRCVAMVGDGINDAPALAQSDIGIAVHSGTDVAIETADIILMRDRLSDVVAAIQLSRATFNKIQQNLFWAFIYNALGIPIAAGVLLPLGILLSPATAGAFMAFSSVSVVTNSLLLRSFKPNKKAQ
jgi:Cu2+-exporting ATPase